MDLELVETGDGGDVIKKPRDLSVIGGFENFPYLSMFGGNVDQSTPTERVKSEQAFDFWGNNLLWPGDESVQFNSLTERVLKQTALNSSGRVIIQEAVKKDLEHMQEYAQVLVDVIISGVDRLGIGIRLIRLDNLERRDFIYIWDATMQELTARQPTSASASGMSFHTFDYTFDFTFE